MSLNRLFFFSELTPNRELSQLKDVANILIKTTGDFMSYWISCTALSNNNHQLYSLSRLLSVTQL